MTHPVPIQQGAPVVALFGRAPVTDLEALLRPPPGATGWSEEPVSRPALAELHALMSLGPSQLDASPTRALFLTSYAAKLRLSPYLADSVRLDLLSAPVCAVLGYDAAFASQLVEFMPDPFGDPEGHAGHLAALRNGVVQGAYLTVAARALGLEVVPGLASDPAGLSGEFFRNPNMRLSFLCGLGYPARRAA